MLYIKRHVNYCNRNAIVHTLGFYMPSELITLHSLLGDIYHGLVAILTMILPLLEKAVVPLVTVGGTLGGVYWAQKGQREIKKMELIHQKETAKEQFKREIIEKIHKGYGKLDSDTQLIYATFLKVYNNHNNYTSAIEHIQKHLSNSDDFADYTPLYFPEIHEYYMVHIFELSSLISYLSYEIEPCDINIENYNKLRSAMDIYIKENKIVYQLIKNELAKLEY